MAAARAGAASAPMARSRSWISASRSGRRSPPRPAGLAVPYRPASTVSSRLGGAGRRLLLDLREAGAGGSRMSPPSSARSPAMARSKVDLPAPLRPTRPMRRPGSTRQLGAVEQGAAAEADGDAGDGEQAHGGGIYGGRARGRKGLPWCGCCSKARAAPSGRGSPRSEIMATERTLSIIKPDATRRNLTGRINAWFEDAGLRIVAQKRLQLTEPQAEALLRGAPRARRSSATS